MARRTTARGLLTALAVITGLLTYYGLEQYSFYVDLQPEAELTDFSSAADDLRGRIVAVTGLVTKSPADIPSELMTGGSPWADNALQLKRCRGSGKSERCRIWRARTACVAGYAISPDVAASPFQASSREVDDGNSRLEIWPINVRYTIVAMLDQNGKALIPARRTVGKPKAIALVIDAQENPTRHMKDLACTAYIWACVAFFVSSAAFVSSGSFRSTSGGTGAWRRAFLRSGARALLVVVPMGAAMMLSHTPWRALLDLCAIATIAGLIIWGVAQAMLYFRNNLLT